MAHPCGVPSRECVQGLITTTMSSTMLDVNSIAGQLINIQDIWIVLINKYLYGAVQDIF